MNDELSRKSGLPRLLLSPWIYHGFRLFIGALFVYTGTTKLFDTAGFAQSIAAYGILPAVLLPCAAVGLPAVELVAGLGTLFNRRWALLGVLAMMILFTSVLGYGVAAGLEIDCGCFGTEEGASAAQSGPASILDIPGEEGSILGGNEIIIEPVQEDAAEETCSEGGETGIKTLWPALIRDIFLLLGVVYLVAWPDLRRKCGMIGGSTFNV
jgi:uncharacterized membrane protein YphA (DoxX/SURF4 family)